MAKKDLLDGLSGISGANLGNKKEEEQDTKVVVVAEEKTETPSPKSGEGTVQKETPKSKEDGKEEPKDEQGESTGETPTNEGKQEENEGDDMKKEETAKKRKRRTLVTPKEKEKKDKYAGTMISMPEDINEAMEKYVAELKEEGVKLYDPIHEKDRKISKSSWIVLLIEQELQRKGRI